MHNYLVVFSVTTHDGNGHYKGIILLDGETTYQFAQIFPDFSDFKKWFEDYCKTMADNQPYCVFDQQILTGKVDEVYCWDIS